MHVDTLEIKQYTPFILSMTDLKRVEEEINKELKQSKEKRKVTLKRSIRKENKNYTATLFYDTPVRANDDLLQRDMLEVERNTRFSIDCSWMRARITDVSHLKGYWDFRNGQRKTLEGATTWDITIRIIGMPEQRQIRLLRVLCDRLDLPKRQGDGYFTTYGEGSGGEGGNTYPWIILRKRLITFSENENAISERKLTDLYESVKRVVVEEGITNQFVLTNIIPRLKGLTLGQYVKKYYRVDLDESILQSSIEAPYEFSPLPTVSVRQPLNEREYPALNPTARGWRRQMIEEIVSLTYSPNIPSVRRLKK